MKSGESKLADVLGSKKELEINRLTEDQAVKRLSSQASNQAGEQFEK